MTARGRGFALLECMISILLLSVGLLGLVGLSSRMTQSTGDAENRARAAGLADEIVTFMWTNQTNTPTAAQIQTLVTNWQAKPFQALPPAPASTTNNVSVGGATSTLAVAPVLVQVSAPSTATATLANVTVTIQWQAPSASTPDQYVTVVAFPS